MPTGTIKFINQTKGFGFIKPSDKSSDIFVHVTELEGEPINYQNDMEVVYDVKEGKKGLCAVNVKFA